MTTDGRKTDLRRKRNRFVIQDDEIENHRRHVPSAEEEDKADGVFDRILKNRKQGRS